MSGNLQVPYTKILDFSQQFCEQVRIEFDLYSINKWTKHHYRLDAIIIML